MCIRDRIATVFQLFPTPSVLYISYPVSWIVTAAVQMAFFLIVRKHAYAKVAGLHGLAGQPAPEA